MEGVERRKVIDSNSLQRERSEKVSPSQSTMDWLKIGGISFFWRVRVDPDAGELAMSPPDAHV